MYQRILVSLVCLGIVACSNLSTQEKTNSQNISSNSSTSNIASRLLPTSNSRGSSAENDVSSQLKTSMAKAKNNPNTVEKVAVSETASLDIPRLDTTKLTHELLQTRKYHGDEVMAASGEQWWGLFVTDNGFELLPTTISVNTVRDVIVDLEDGEMTGKEVVTDQLFPSVFLVKGPILLKPGVVKTVFFGSASIPNRFQEGRSTGLSLSLDTSIDSDVSNLYSFTIEDFTQNEIPKTVLTFFAHGEQKTQKYELGGCCDMIGPSLIWAGDLDRDGKLDFLLDTSTHYNVSQPTLFLSSPAQAGEIVRPVANMRSVGC